MINRVGSHSVFLFSLGAIFANFTSLLGAIFTVFARFLGAIFTVFYIKHIKSNSCKINAVSIEE